MTILLSSCRKEKFSEPIQPIGNTVSAFDSENSCLDEIIPSQIDAYQRELAADIYGNLISARSEYLEFGTPVWPGVVTYIDSSTFNHRLNLVPLIDEDTDSVSALLFIDIAGQYYNAFFVSKKVIIHEQFDSLESVLGENIYSIRQLEILELFECFECILYCRNLSVVTRDPGPVKCPKWKDKPRRGRFRRGNGGGNGSNDPNDFTVYILWGNGRSLYSYASSGNTSGSGTGSNGAPTYSPGQFKPRIENCDGLGDIYDTGPNNPLNGHPDSAFCLALHELRECVPSIGDDSDVIDWFLWYDTYYDNQAWEGMQNFACTNKLPPDIKDEAIRWFIENAYQNLLSWNDYNASLVAIQGLYLQGTDISYGELTCLVNQPFASQSLGSYVEIGLYEEPELRNEIINFACVAIDLLCIDPDVRMERMIELNELLKVNPNALIENCEQSDGHDLSFWSDLASFTPPQSVIDTLGNYEGDWSIQSITDASAARVNLDYFAINITQLPDIDGDGTAESIKEVFDYIRYNFDGYHTQFLNNNLAYFVPITAINETKWHSPDPLTTIGSFEIPFNDGSVIVSHTEHCCWIFSTLDCPWNSNQSNFTDDNKHPVSGNRQFGFIAETDGSFTIYCKGADRVERFLAGLVSQFSYSIADLLWESFQSKIRQFIVDKGGAATVIQPEYIRPKWNNVKNALRSQAPLTYISCN